MQILVYAHAHPQACPDPLGGHLMFQNVCNKILVTEPKHYYLVLGGFGFGAIQYNFPGGGKYTPLYLRRVKGTNECGRKDCGTKECGTKECGINV